MFSVQDFVPRLGGINDDDTIGGIWSIYCPWTRYSFALAGGRPYGGVYSGFGVSNNVFYGDSAGYEFWDTAIGGSLDTITYTFIDSNGCSAHAKATVEFNTCEAINDITLNNQISLYPNPATDLIDIKTEGIQPQTTNIYDVNGQLVSTMRFAPQVDVSNLAAGVYLMEVTAPEGTARRRFVKLM